MLRPEQMSKLSVTGSKRVMNDVIETLHDLHIVHITDYDESWEGFKPGSSLEGADEVSSKLVTVRALESILNLEATDVGPTTTVDLTNADERLEEVREEVNELDDRRDELRNRRRDIDEQLDQMELFADLGIDLELLWGYDSLEVLVGEGDAAAIEGALGEADDVDEFEVFSGTKMKSVAVFAYMDGDERLDDALVGVPFTSYDVPETSGDPESNVAELTQERKQVEAELEKVKNELETVKLNKGNFLLALEEELTVEAEKSEAPLRFATTERSFIVEGWVPTDKYDDLAETLETEVGEQIETSELKRAVYTDSGGHHEEVHDEDDGHGGSPGTDKKRVADDESADKQKVAADGGQATEASAAGTGDVVTDGGHSDGDLVTVDDEPPVVQKNSKVVNPFEILVRAVNQPKYNEFDPTVAIFLTFPVFFGFMIGDIGYGILYVLIGYWVYKKFDTETLANFGTVVAWLGLWTIIFGVFYGEIFGLHFLYWFGYEPLLYKGIASEAWAVTWLLIAVLAGWIHLNIGYIFSFIREWQLHNPKEAVVEVGSWILMLNGLWVWIFSFHAAGNKPDFLVGSEALLATGPLGFGFEGFPELVGLIGLVAFALGIVILLTGPWYEVVEFLVPLAHTLSYTRLTAVLLAKAGMAVAANLLYFGAYQDDEGAFHYMHAGTVDDAGGEVVFNGLANMGTHVSVGPLDLGIEGAIIGIPVLILGHIVVLAIGGTAAIQAIRLEYFEFFEKFYEGGGKKYEPFGHERTHTSDN